tara:strand:+ start:1795 stop:1947 length:153 start_codon:yes stop_codon:yes gene_type:complete
MYHCEIDNKKIKVRDIFNNYEIYEKRLRRSELETEWLKEMLDKDKWKYIM